MTLPSYVAEQIQYGHTMRPDPDWGSTVVHRYMCLTCDAEVYWTIDITFGNATERTCAEMIEWWETRE